MRSRLPVPVPPMAASVAWRYIGAYTRQAWEKRDAWALATEVSAGSMWRSAMAVFCSLTVGYT